MKKFLFFSAASLFTLCVAQVNAANVEGKVVDKATNLPITGVTVVEKGTSNGVITIDGSFNINTAEEPSVLVFSFMGYQTSEVAVSSSQTSLIVELDEGGVQLDDVLVIGYGTTTEEAKTGSISSIKADAIVDYPATSFASALAGQAAGVQIIQANGAPGTEANIRIRGIGTLTAGSDPLIVVDGFPLTEGSSINSINPSSIESIEILKDAASTAIYGSRGANGIIMVKTKRGRSGKPQISASASYGIQVRQDDLKLVGAYDFAQFQLDARNTGYVNADPSNRSVNDSYDERIANGATKRMTIPDYIIPYLNGESGLTDTDWYDEIFRVAPIQDYNLSVTGGNDTASYSLTGGVMSQDGILIGTDYTKYSANMNIEFRPTKNIKIGASFSPSYVAENETVSSNTWGGTLHALASISYPCFSAYNEDGSYAISEQILANDLADGALCENPVAWANMLTNNTNTGRMFGNAYTEINFLKDFTYKVNVGVDYSSSQSDYFRPSTIGYYRVDASNASAEASRSTSNYLNALIENTLTYNKDFGLNNLQFLAGQSYQNEEYNSLGITASGFVDNSITNIAGGSSFGVTPSHSAWSMISYFSRLNYNYDNKYMINGSLRWDGSSRFGDDSKWGLFPAVSGAWVASKESFMSDIEAVDFAKLRLSWGKSGNNQIGNYGAQAVMKDSNYVYGGSLSSGTIISTSPNTGLSWEMTSTVNVGIDLTIKKYIGLSMDYYIATTNDLLLDVPVPQQSGYTESLQNIGSVRNKGFEVRLYTAKDVELGGGFAWNSNLNFSMNRDEVLALADGQTQIISGCNITEVGGSIGALYGYVVDGIFKSEEQLAAYPSMSGTQIGDHIIRDLDGDGEITTNDRKSYGSPSAKAILGFNNRFTYRNFELSFDIYAELGKQKYSGTLQSLECGEGFQMCTQYYFDNYYHPVTNPEGTLATPNMGSYSNQRKAAAYSNVFFMDASYVSLRTLKFAYDIPTASLEKLGLGRLQVYALANNLWVLTPYRGFNVAAESNSSILEQGTEKYAYPMATTISLGVNVNF